MTKHFTGDYDGFAPGLSAGGASPSEPKDLTTDELVKTISNVEKLLAALRSELSQRTDQKKFCGDRWSKFTCSLKPGHEGRHSQGFIVWPRK